MQRHAIDLKLQYSPNYQPRKRGKHQESGIRSVPENFFAEQKNFVT